MVDVPIPPNHTTHFVSDSVYTACRQNGQSWLADASSVILRHSSLCACGLIISDRGTVARWVTARQCERGPSSMPSFQSGRFARIRRWTIRHVAGSNVCPETHAPYHEP